MFSRETTSARLIKIDTICEVLRQAAIGETITFKQINEHLGEDVTEQRYLLEAARKRLLEQDKIRFDSVFGVGLKRMDVSDAIDVCKKRLRSIRKGAKTEAVRIHHQMAGANDVSSDTRFTLNSYRGLLGSIEELASTKAIKAVEKVKDDRILPFGKVLEVVVKGKIY